MFLFLVILSFAIRIHSSYIIHFHLYVLQLYIEGLCHGNLLEEEAIGISNIFKANFSVPPLPVEMRYQESVISLPSGANLVRDVSAKNKLERNSVFEVTEPGCCGITSKFPPLTSLFLLLSPLFLSSCGLSLTFGLPCSFIFKLSRMLEWNQ